MTTKCFTMEGSIARLIQLKTAALALARLQMFILDPIALYLPPLVKTTIYTTKTKKLCESNQKS